MTKLSKLILLIIHLIYTIYILIKSQFLFVYNEISKLLNPQYFKLYEDILNNCDNANFKKIPEHLVVVIGSENISFIDVTRIIGWAVALEIPHVSLYDQDGVFKKHVETIRKDVEQSIPHLYPRIMWEQKKSHPVETKANGKGYVNSTRVHFLSYTDGKGDIIDLTKEIVQAVQRGVLKCEEVDGVLINEKMTFKYPEPDLAIVCGKTFSTFGLLPWHIRLTTFLHLPTHHNISPKTFYEVLRKFGACEQRHGK